jgi:hypothetical protein
LPTFFNPLLHIVYTRFLILQYWIFAILPY